jgi:hypothetical protein
MFKNLYRDIQLTAFAMTVFPFLRGADALAGSEHGRAPVSSGNSRGASLNRQQDWSASYEDQWRSDHYDTGQDGLYWLWDTADGASGAWG